MLGVQVNRDEVGGAQSGEEVDAVSGLEGAGTHVTSANMMPKPKVNHGVTKRKATFRDQGKNTGNCNDSATDSLDQPDAKQNKNME